MGDAAANASLCLWLCEEVFHAYVSCTGGYVIEVPLPFPFYDHNDVIDEF